MASKRWRNGNRRTLVHFDALDSFVVHCSGASLDELVALDADIDNLCSFDGELDELLHDIVDDVRSGLWREVSVFFSRSGAWSCEPCI
jgi:hypothetical protein